MGRELSMEVQTPKTCQLGSEISKKLVADLMVAALRQGNFDYLKLFGFKPSQVAIVRNLRLRDQNRLQQLYRDCLTNIRIEVDPIRLESTLDRMVQFDQEEDLIDNMLRLGAGQDVMRALCGLHDKETVARRRDLGAEVSYGRARKPELEIQLGIAVQWSQLASAEPNLRKRIIRLAESSGLSIATIWRILRDSKVPIDDSPKNNGAGAASSTSTPSELRAQDKARVAVLPLATPLEEIQAPRFPQNLALR